MKKLVLFFTLIIIMVVSVQAQSHLGRFEYTQRVRSQTFRDATGNDTVRVPVRMTRIDYNQRTRAQIIRMSEDVDTVKRFPGILINDKIGRGEKTTFVISNRLVSDVPYCFIVDPQRECPVSLPAGEYVMEIYCGSYYKAHIFHVDPRRTHSISGKMFYFAAVKYLSDL